MVIVIKLNYNFLIQLPLILFLDNSTFSCQKCKNEFMSYKELEEHLKTHQLKSKSTNLHLTCGKYLI